MRILICASDAPIAPMNGARVVLRALTTRLAQRHEVHVLAFRWPGQQGPPPPGVVVRTIDARLPTRWRGVAERAGSLMARQPIDVWRLTRPMIEAIAAARAQSRFDVAHVMLGELASVAPALDGLPAIIAPLDAWPLNVAAAGQHARGARRLWLGAQRRVVARYTSRAYRPFRRVVLVTTGDARETLRLDPTLHVEVITNGVDAEYYAPTGDARDARLMLFTGALAFPPNARAAHVAAAAVLPRVRRDLPDARLVIAGRDPGPEVRALADLPGVSVVANPPDLRPILGSAGVYVCPMRDGTGVKNKLLEALACGAPSVATPLACQGLAVHDGVEVLLADHADAMARHVVRVMTDADLAARLSHGGRAYVLGAHSWDDVASRYEELYRRVIAE
jgi:glycosyltransferase involved in cell wall biosynthesis